MAEPIITVDAAFGSLVTAASYSWTNIHRDDGVQRARGVRYHRGRLNELNRMETGTGEIRFKDPKSYFDPDNTASPWYPNVRAYVPIRAQATIAGTTYNLFQQYAYGLPRPVRVRDAYTERIVTTVDAFEWFARAGLSGESYAQEATGTRVANVLNSISWPSGLRSLDAGISTVTAASYTASDGAKALSHLLDVADWENGLLFVNGAGSVVFVQRHSLIRAPYTTSQATFCDAVAGGGYPFVGVVPTFDPDTTFNEWSGTRTGGVTQTVSDQTSHDRYGERAKQFSSGVTSDAEVLSQMQWKLAQFKEPLNRIESITVQPGTNTGFWQAVLGLEIGQRITVREQPPGFTTAKSADYTIQSIDATLPAGPARQARFTFGLWPSDTNAWFVLDDANNGKFDTAKFAY